MHKFVLNVAGAGIEIRSEDREIINIVKSKYGHFRGASGEHRVLMSAMEKTEGPGRGDRFDIGIRRRAGKLLVENLRMIGEYDFHKKLGSLRFHGEYTEDAIENYLRIVFSHVALQRKMILVHCSGVVRNGIACLFVGKSGSGKSTIAGLSAGMDVLSDDLVAVEAGEKHAWARSVPFRGTAGTGMDGNMRARLGAVLFIHKAERNRIAEIKPAAAITMLVACAPFVNDDKCMSALLLQRVAAVVASTRCANLYFRKNPSFWKEIERQFFPG
jgi:hypothetical protein